MTRLLKSELFFQAYALTLVTLTMIAVIHFLCDYAWATSALCGIATVSSFFVGQGIVTVIQNRQRSGGEPVRQESDWH